MKTEQLLANVTHWIDALEAGDIDAVLEHALELEYIVGPDGDYRGARLLMAYGGPTVWIETRHARIVGTWGLDEISRIYDDGGALDDHLSSLRVTPC